MLEKNSLPTQTLIRHETSINGKNFIKYYLEELFTFYKKYSSNQFEIMLEKLPSDKKKDFIRTQTIIIKVFALWMTLTFLIYQIPNSYLYFKTGQL